MSADGSVVAGYANNGNSGAEAFRWTGGVMTPLGFLDGSDTSQALAISADGSTVVGHVSGASGIAGWAFKWSGGTMTSVAFNACGGQGPFAYGVNSGGSVIVGQTDGHGAPCTDSFPGRAVEWVNGAESLLFPTPPPPSGLARGVNLDGSVIVGEVGVPNCGNNNSCLQAFRWIGGAGVILGDLGGNYSSAYAANSDGSVIVGTAAVSNTENQPFRWSLSTGLVGLGGQGISSIAYAVNADGSVVVGKIGNPGRAFRWTATTGIQFIDDLLTAAGVDISGWSAFTAATGVSADGQTIVGNGSFGASAEAWIAHLPLQPATIHWAPAGTAEFDGDAKTDVLWRASNGVVTEWLMNGASFTPVGGQSVPLGWSVVGIGDFNGDGVADILWRYTDGTVVIWFMNPDGSVASSVGLGQIDGAWQIIGVGNFFPGDKHADILWRHTSGVLAMWQMNGATIAGNFGLGSLPLDWSILGVGDVEGDGAADILWRHSSGAVAEWQMNGGTIAANVGLPAVPLGWTLAGVRDFNGDGVADVLWRNLDGTISIWLMTKGAGTISASVGGQNVPTGWSIAGAGDFDGDGVADILWRYTNGTVVIWFMNPDGTVKSSQSVGVVP